MVTVQDLPHRGTTTTTTQVPAGTVAPAAVARQVQPAQTGSPTPSNNTASTPGGDTAFSWDGSQYHLNWSTKGLTAGLYRVSARLADGTTRTFLADGDTVTIRGRAAGTDGGVVDLGAVEGRVVPAQGVT